MSDSLIQAMLSTIRRFSMVEKGEKVLVAVSGGPDSVALLHALWSVRNELGISLHVAHLNHSFRGRESDLDAEYVCGLAANLSLDWTVEKIDVPQIQRSLRLSPEEAARLVRYEFLERVAADVHADRIALAHTADDQVETVLLNVLRGTGVDGLSGMPPVRGKIIRPLISIRRSEVEDYVERNSLHPRVDATNLLPMYTRNRLRLELLPLLRREFNPEIDAALLRLMELAREDTAYLNMGSKEALGRLTISREEGAISLDLSGLLSCPLAIRRRLIREAVRTVRGELADVGFTHVEELLRLLGTGSDFKYELPGGTFVERTRQALAFLFSRPLELPIIYCYELAVPGETRVPEIEATLEAEVGLTPVEPFRPPGSMEVVLDGESIVGKLRVRNWQPGDRIRPLGLRGSKKVQDIFVDAKIPRAARHRVPLIADDEKVVWVAGLALSELVKVTGATRQFVQLRAVRA
ncbi:MAG TPA: tRNA lysidine(34) synthetase TilS [Armatimonadota bacterium]|nr:tRNA lysidine(34) synthetase TilS [Armatimonadota bacterium]